MGSWTNRTLDWGRLCAAMALPAVAALLVAAPDARAQDKSRAHALLGRDRRPAARAVALHHLAQQVADPLRGRSARRPARAQGRCRPAPTGTWCIPPEWSSTSRPRWPGAGAVESFVEGADLRTRSGDDGAAKVCVFFDFPADRLSVGERTRLSLARRATGEDGADRDAVLRLGQQGSQGQRVRQRLHQAHAHGGARIRRRGQRRAAGPPSAATCWPTTSRAFGDEAGDTRPDVTAVRGLGRRRQHARPRHRLLLGPRPPRQSALADAAAPRPRQRRPNGRLRANSGSPGPGLHVTTSHERLRRAPRQPGRRPGLRRHAGDAASGRRCRPCRSWSWRAG